MAGTTTAASASKFLGTSGILASSSDLTPSKIITQSRSRLEDLGHMREKSVTRLADNGLRIMQTNSML